MYSGNHGLIHIFWLLAMPPQVKEKMRKVTDEMVACLAYRGGFFPTLMGFALFYILKILVDLSYNSNDHISFINK